MSLFSTSRAFSRAGVLSSGARSITSQRHYSSTIPPPFRGSVASHVAAAVGGGFIVLGGAYSWYHFSGIKKAVDTVKNMRTTLKNTKISFSRKGKALDEDEQRAIAVEMLSNDPSARHLAVAAGTILTNNPSPDDKAKVKTAILEKLRKKGIFIEPRSSDEAESS